jgi:mannan endo-1,4-beta-mannosidase
MTGLRKLRKAGALIVGAALLVSTIAPISVTASSVIVYGDANNDGTVDSLDFIQFKQYIMNPDKDYIQNMDLNLDISIDAVDCGILKQYLLGTIINLPYEPIKENQPPVAAFTGVPKEACISENVNFSGASSYDPDGTVNSYSWDFGDGKVGTGGNTVHSYGFPGTYSVRLTVTDDKGLSSISTDTITVINAFFDNTDINFEDGKTNGFRDMYERPSAFSVTTEKAFLGSRSLKWDAKAEVGYAEAFIDTTDKLLKPGDTVTFRVWIPSDAPIKSITAFYYPHDFSFEKNMWCPVTRSYDSMKKNDWNELSVTIPNYTDPAWTWQQFGIHVEPAAEGDFTMYIDSIDW